MAIKRRQHNTQYIYLLFYGTLNNRNSNHHLQESYNGLLVAATGHDTTERR